LYKPQQKNEKSSPVPDVGPEEGKSGLPPPWKKKPKKYILERIRKKRLFQKHDLRISGPLKDLPESSRIGDQLPSRGKPRQEEGSRRHKNKPKKTANCFHEERTGKPGSRPVPQKKKNQPGQGNLVRKQQAERIHGKQTEAAKEKDPRPTPG